MTAETFSIGKLPKQSLPLGRFFQPLDKKVHKYRPSPTAVVMRKIVLEKVPVVLRHIFSCIPHVSSFDATLA